MRKVILAAGFLILISCGNSERKARYLMGHYDYMASIYSYWASSAKTTQGQKAADSLEAISIEFQRKADSMKKIYPNTLESK